MSASSSHTRQADAPLPAGTRRWLTLSITLAVFMNVLDVTIANVSIPTIAGGLGVSASQGTWLITSFAVANAITLPTSGWLARQVGEVKLFVSCTALFTLASFICGLAPTFDFLLLMRVIQGAVAGPMLPLSLSLLLSNYPVNKRGMANGLWGMAGVVGPVAGPVLGGWLTTNIGWRWIFFVNVPIGVFCVLVTWIILHKRETETSREPLDIIGLVLLAIGVGAFQIMIDKGTDEGWFQSPFIIILAIVAVVFLSFWVVWELTEDNPVVDLRLFGNRNFLVATLVMTAGFIAYAGGLVLLPLWLQTSLGYTPIWAGLASASIALLAIFGAPVVGHLSDRFDLRLLVTFGMLVFAVSSFLSADANSHITFQQVFMARLPMGIGVACFFVPLITLSLTGLPQSRIASASSLFNFMRQMGLAVGTSLSVTLWDRRQAYHDHILSSLTSAGSPATEHWLARAQAAGMTLKQAYASMANLVRRESFMMALNEVYVLAGVLFLILSVAIWLSRPIKS